MRCRQWHAGSIAFTQRAGSALNLNPHIRALMLDGVFTEVNGRYLNAASNIRNHAVSYTVAGDARKACGEDGSGSKAVKRPRVKPASMKQESSVELTQVGLGRS